MLGGAYNYTAELAWRHSASRHYQPSTRKKPSLDVREMFSEGISAATDSGKEIAGLKKMQNNFDDTKIEELLTGEFSRG